MFKLFRRSVAKAVRKAGAASLRAAAALLGELVAPAAKPARKGRAAKPAAPKPAAPKPAAPKPAAPKPAAAKPAAAKPAPQQRGGLGAVVRQITAAFALAPGPASTAKPRADPAAARRIAASAAAPGSPATPREGPGAVQRRTTADAAPTPTPTARPRERLGDAVRRIKAGAALAPAAPALAMPRGAAFETLRHAGAHGARDYRLYTPAAGRAGAGAAPLVVMLHGCTQTPEDFALGSRMNALAEEFGLLVAYPEQPVGANPHRCWNWFNRGDQARGAGEPALIAGIARAVLRQRGADPARVYVAGLSAGGAAAIIAATAYPDVFAAAGVHSGLPVGAASNAASAFVAMKRGAVGVPQPVAVPTIVFHGDADTVVHPRNGRSVAERAAGPASRLAATEIAGRSAGGRDFLRTVRSAADGAPFCEHWLVAGAGHAWSGGHPAGSYSDPAGPDASREMVRFFLTHRKSRAQRSLAAAAAR